MKYPFPILFITGTDGSGKTTLTKSLKNQLQSEGVSTRVVWSRYNNFFSKPLLAIARLSGHNYYEIHGGHIFGYHRFERLPGFKQLFIIFQCIDVNIATYKNIYRKVKKNEILICERGPWDTLVDVILDTGQDNLAETFIGRLFIRMMVKQSQVFFVFRSRANILENRPELAFDKSLNKKLSIYKELSEKFKWQVIDNNKDLALAQKELFDSVKKHVDCK